MSRFGRAKQKKWTAPTNPLEAEATKGVLEDLPGRKFNNKDLYIAQRIDKLSVITNPSPAQTAELNALVKIRADSQIEAFEASQDDAFASDFQNFLQGRLKIEEAKRVNWPVNITTAYDGTGAPVLPPAQAHSTIRLNHLPGVQGYLDKYADARLRYEQAIERMKKLGPVGLDGKVDLDVLYVYYKYVVRGVSTGEDEFLRDWKFFDKRGPKPFPNTLAEQLADTNELNAQADERMGHMVPDNSVGPPGDAMGNNVVGNIAQSEVPVPVQVVISPDSDQEDIASATAAARAGVVDQATMKEFTNAGKQFAAAAKQLGKNKADNSAMVAQLKNLATAVGDLQAKLATSDPGIGELKSALTVGPDSLVSLMKQVVSASQALHTDLADLPTKFDNLAAKVENVAKLNSGGASGRGGSSGLSPELQKQFDDLNAALAALNARSDALEKTNKELNEKLTTAETEKDGALTDLANRMDAQQQAAVKSVEDAALAKVADLSKKLTELEKASADAIKAKETLIETLEQEAKKGQASADPDSDEEFQKELKKATRKAALIRAASGQAEPKKSQIEMWMEWQMAKDMGMGKKAQGATPIPKKTKTKSDKGKGPAVAPPNDGDASSDGSLSTDGLPQNPTIGRGTLRPTPIWYGDLTGPPEPPKPVEPGPSKKPKQSRSRGTTRSARRTEFDTKEQEEDSRPDLNEWKKDREGAGPRAKTPRGGIIKSVAAGIKAAGGYTAKTLFELGSELTVQIAKKFAEQRKTADALKVTPEGTAKQMREARLAKLEEEIKKLREQRGQVRAEQGVRGVDAPVDPGDGPADAGDDDDDDDDFQDAQSIPPVRGGGGARVPRPPATPSPRPGQPGRVPVPPAPRPPGGAPSRGGGQVPVPPVAAPRPHDIPGSIVRNNPVPPRGGPVAPPNQQPPANNHQHQGALANLKLMISKMKRAGKSPTELADIADFFDDEVGEIGDRMALDQDLIGANGLIAFIENELTDQDHRNEPAYLAIRDYLLTRRFALEASIRERDEAAAQPQEPGQPAPVVKGEPPSPLPPDESGFTSLAGTPPADQSGFTAQAESPSPAQPGPGANPPPVPQPGGASLPQPPAPADPGDGDSSDGSPEPGKPPGKFGDHTPRGTTPGSKGPLMPPSEPIEIDPVTGNIVGGAEPGPSRPRKTVEDYEVEFSLGGLSYQQLSDIASNPNKFSGEEMIAAENMMKALEFDNNFANAVYEDDDDQDIAVSKDLSTVKRPKPVGNIKIGKIISKKGKEPARQVIQSVATDQDIYAIVGTADMMKNKFTFEDDTATAQRIKDDAKDDPEVQKYKFPRFDYIDFGTEEAYALLGTVDKDQLHRMHDGETVGFYKVNRHGDIIRKKYKEDKDGNVIQNEGDKKIFTGKITQMERARLRARWASTLGLVAKEFSLDMNTDEDKNLVSMVSSIRVKAERSHYSLKQRRKVIDEYAMVEYIDKDGVVQQAINPTDMDPKEVSDKLKREWDLIELAQGILLALEKDRPVLKIGTKTGSVVLPETPRNKFNKRGNKGGGDPTATKRRGK